MLAEDWIAGANDPRRSADLEHGFVIHRRSCRSGLPEPPECKARRAAIARCRVRPTASQRPLMDFAVDQNQRGPLLDPRLASLKMVFSIASAVNSANSGHRLSFVVISGLVLAVLSMTFTFRGPGRRMRHTLFAACWIGIAEIIAWYFRELVWVCLLIGFAIASVFFFEYDRWHRLSKLRDFAACFSPVSLVAESPRSITLTWRGFTQVPMPRLGIMRLRSDFKVTHVSSHDGYVRLFLEGPTVEWGPVVCWIYDASNRHVGYANRVRVMRCLTPGRRRLQSDYSATQQGGTLDHGTYTARWTRGPHSAAWEPPLAEDEFEL